MEAEVLNQLGPKRRVIGVLLPEHLVQLYTFLHMFKIASSLQLFNMEDCSFCSEPCVVHCMNRSLYHKHNQEDQRPAVVINELLARGKTSAYIKYIECIIESDRREFMIEYMKPKAAHEEFDHLQEYYKYRIYVPLFAKARATDTVLAYYYQKLKHYYNNIKRKLHITVDPSSSSSSELTSLSQSNISTKEELLKDIKWEIELDRKRKVLPNLINYKSESKALEELVSDMRLNSRFEDVQTLKTEDCFQEQHLFEQTNKRSNKKLYFNEPVRTHIKSKLFKKLIDRSSGIKTPAQCESNRERPPSRSKSIKFLKVAEKREFIKTDRNPTLSTPFKIRQEDILKESQARLSNAKKHSSLTKLNQNNFSSQVSPYKKKSLSKEKGKTASSTIAITLKGRHIPIQPLRAKNDERGKIKQSITKIQTVKFQNEVLKNKTTPNSPSARKTSKNEEIQKSDNILSIRKKKLEMLKEKVARK